MTAVLWIVSAIVVVVLSTELIRRLPPQLGAGLFLAIPIVLAPSWIGTTEASLFSFVKVYSVCVAAVYVQILKSLRRAPQRAALLFGYLILALNIVEAAVVDAARTSKLNAAAGILLVLAQAYPSAISVSGDGERRSVLCNLGGWWVASYTLWNFAFVYGHRPSFAAFAVVHLGAPLVVCRGRADAWIEARTIALSIAMIVRMTAPRSPFVVLVPEWHIPAVEHALHVASLGLALFVALRAIREGRRSGTRRNLLATIAHRLFPGKSALEPASLGYFNASNPNVCFISTAQSTRDDVAKSSP